MEDIIKIVKYLEDSGLLLKGVAETVQNEVKEQKGGYQVILGASLLGNLLTGQGIYRAGKGKNKEVLRSGEVVLWAGHGCPLQNKMDF